MSVTCCPLSGSDGDTPSASTHVRRKARKDHRCCECDGVITPGTVYEYVSGIWDGRPASFKTCPLCAEIRSHFACDGYIFGALWDDLKQNFFPDMRAGGPCMEGLSPDAKARLFERRSAWWEAVGAGADARRSGDDLLVLAGLRWRDSMGRTRWR
jgi:hypothetical protein